jgi:hypothetical protein
MLAKTKGWGSWQPVTKKVDELDQNFANPMVVLAVARVDWMQDKMVHFGSGEMAGLLLHEMIGQHFSSWNSLRSGNLGVHDS